ncbi:MAG: undecaprenyl-diphosphate phosphatase, partial [Acidobacteriota bacterium]
AVAIGFLVTALWLWLGDRRDYTEESARQATFHDAAIIGLWQVLALVPGISRSGTTIAAGRWQGLSRSRATHFSFLLSGPIIAGAGFSSLGRLVADSSAYPPLLLAVGFMAALASGLMAIAGVLRFIERTSFWSFSVYLVIVAAALLAVSYVPGLSEAR